MHRNYFFKLFAIEAQERAEMLLTNGQSTLMAVPWSEALTLVAMDQLLLLSKFRLLSVISTGSFDVLALACNVDVENDEGSLVSWMVEINSPILGYVDNASSRSSYLDLLLGYNIGRGLIGAGTEIVKAGNT